MKAGLHLKIHWQDPTDRSFGQTDRFQGNLVCKKEQLAVQSDLVYFTNPVDCDSARKRNPSRRGDIDHTLVSTRGVVARTESRRNLKFQVKVYLRKPRGWWQSLLSKSGMMITKHMVDGDNSTKVVSYLWQQTYLQVTAKQYPVYSCKHSRRHTSWDWQWTWSACSILR